MQLTYYAAKAVSRIIQASHSKPKILKNGKHFWRASPVRN